MKKALLAAVLMGFTLTGCNQKSENNQIKNLAFCTLYK